MRPPRAPSSARAPTGCAAYRPQRGRDAPRTPECLARDRGPHTSPTGGPVQRAVVHTPGGGRRRPSAPTLQSGSSRLRPRQPAGLPEPGPRPPRPAAAHSPERGSRSAADPARGPQPTRNPLTPGRKCGPRLSDPQPAAPLAAPRAVLVIRRPSNQHPARRSRRGRGYADHVLRTASPSAPSESGSHGRVAARSANQRLEKVGFCRY